MKQYTKLADIYDYLVQGIDYDDWYNYIKEIAAKYQVQVTTAVDVACGTGHTTLPFARDGLKIYGVDLSEAMLEKAKQKAVRENLKIEYLQQDMREMSIPQKVDLVTCYHDGLNYITSLSDLEKVFAKVYLSLRTGGLFVFDMNAVSKLAKGVSADTTFLDEENMSLIWETSYICEEDVWEISLTGFLKKGDLYEKFHEVHQEKSYTRAEVLAALEKVGFNLLADYHGFSFDPPRGETRRIFYVAQRSK